MNTITIELCKEDRARLDRIAELLEAQKAGKVNPVENKPQKPEKVEEPAKAQPVGEKKAEPAPAPQADKEEAAPAVTLDDVRQLVVQLAANGKKAEARAIVTKYAKSVGEIPADKVAAVFSELRVIVLGG